MFLSYCLRAYLYVGACLCAFVGVCMFVFFKCLKKIAVQIFLISFQLSHHHAELHICKDPYRRTCHYYKDYLSIFIISTMTEVRMKIRHALKYAEAVFFQQRERIQSSVTSLRLSIFYPRIHHRRAHH